MPSFVSHAVVGLSAGRIWTGKEMPARFWLLSAICPFLADLDVIGLYLGIPYQDVFGHRGFFHSLPFALILGGIVTALFFRGREWSGRRAGLVFYFFLINATHGLLDAMTSGGLGVALFAPFDNTRYFFPWTPIQVAPLGLRAFFSEWGLRVLVSECLWVWIPCLGMVGLTMWWRAQRSKRHG